MQASTGYSLVACSFSVVYIVAGDVLRRPHLLKSEPAC